MKNNNLERSEVEQLRKERDRYRNLFESAPGLYIVLTPDEFRIESVSDAYLDATYTRRDEIIGQRLYDIFPDDPKDSAADGSRNLLASLNRVKEHLAPDAMSLQRYPIKNPFNNEFEERYWSPVNVPVFENGRLALIIHRVEDATLSHRFFSSIESMSDAFYMLDQKFSFTYVNKVAEKLLLKSASEILGRNVWEAFPEAKKTEIYRCYTEALNTGYSRHFELFYPSLEHWFEINVYPSEGGLAVYFRPVTERIQLEQQISQAEERFRLVVQATLDTIWDLNPVTNRLRWNDGDADVFGHSQSDLEPTLEAWIRLIHPDDRITVVNSIHQVISDPDQSSWQQEYRFLCADNSYAIVDDRGFVIRDESGKAIRMLGGITDLTERRLAEQKLSQAQRMESIGQLTGGMAHDFNNLLTVIMGNGDLLFEELSSNARLQPMAEIICTAAQKGADLTQRLLAFARRQMLDPEPVNVDSLIDSMIQLLGRTLGDHIELKFLRSGDDHQAMVDPSQLENSLLNLCINARDAMPRGGVLTITSNISDIDDITFGPLSELRPGLYICIMVTDTGCGISSENIGKVFDPFFSTKDRSKGTGLGLSMVYGFARQSGGYVTISSEPGTGTCIKIFLPAYHYSHSPVLNEKEEVPNKKSGGKSILVVEDDYLVREQVTNQLVISGYIVHAAATAREALEVLENRPNIDLLFTDIMMPGMTGRELAEEVGEIWPEIPVLFTSGYTDESLMREQAGEGELLMLSKPYRKVELLKQVNRAIHGRQNSD